MKSCYVTSLREGAGIEDVFLVVSRSIANTRSGAPFLKIKLGDRTGTIDAVKWNATDSDMAIVTEDAYILVRGSVRTYNGDLQITIDSCHQCENKVDPSDFLACSARDPREMMAELMSILRSVSHPQLSALLRAFFEEEPSASRFSACPAAIRVHHAYVGGLLEHTLNVVKSCAALAELYPQADRDLLLAAAALHDIGKVEEFSWSGSIKISDSGHLVGHIVSGAMMVREAAARIDGFDPMLSLALQHAILAHHGKKEYGSPKQPKSIEAVLLHYADDLDAQVAMFAQAIDESERNGDAGLFTKRHYFLERPVFRGLRSWQPPAPDSSGAPEHDEESFDSDLFAADMDYDPFAEE